MEPGTGGKNTLADRKTTASPSLRPGIRPWKPLKRFLGSRAIHQSLVSIALHGPLRADHRREQRNRRKIDDAPSNTYSLVQPSKRFALCACDFRSRSCLQHGAGASKGPLPRLLVFRREIGKEARSSRRPGSPRSSTISCRALWISASSRFL